MTSPVNVPTPPKKRRSSLKRQRIAVAIVLAAVLLLSAVGIAGMGIGIFADVGVCVLAVCNAMRTLGRTGSAGRK